MRFRTFCYRLYLVGSVALVGTLGACTKKAPVSLESLSPEQLVARGKLIYAQNCISCHNVNPKEAGTVGPALLQDSQEVLRFKIVGGASPAGYKPQRSTAIMPLFPQLEKEIPAIEAYLKSL